MAKIQLIYLKTLTRTLNGRTKGDSFGITTYHGYNGPVL